MDQGTKKCKGFLRICHIYFDVDNGENIYTSVYHISYS